MEFKLNVPYEVNGADLRDYLSSNNNKHQATYNVDPEISYSILIWLDSDKYENKAKMLNDYRREKRRSAHIIIGPAFYILMYSPLSKESLPEAPKDTEVKTDSKKKELPWEAERREKAQKVLDALSKPMVTKDIAKAVNMSYTSILKIMKFLLSQKKVIRKAPAGWKFGESRPELHYHKVEG